MAKKKRTKARAAKPVTDDSARVVRALKARILKEEGSRLNTTQLRDLAWLQKRDSEQIIAQSLEAVPKKLYCKLSDRQHKLIDDAARNYDLPISGPTVNLFEAIKAFHDLIAANANRLRSELGDDKHKLEVEKLRQEIIGKETDNERKAIELSQARGDAIPRSAIRDALVALSAQLRTLGQTLARIDPEARDSLNEFLESLAIEMESGEFRF